MLGILEAGQDKEKKEHPEHFEVVIKNKAKTGVEVCVHVCYWMELWGGWIEDQATFQLLVG